MKDAKKTVFFIFLMLTVLIFVACNLDGGDSATTPDGTTDPFAGVDSVGEVATVTVGLVTFNMVYVPSGITFPTETDDSGIATVANAYLIGETEVTSELWDAVYIWALSNDYTFANAGTMGDGSGDTNQHPVTTINWRDAMVWMNALTEYYNAQNGTSLTCVYKDTGTPIRDSRDNSSGGDHDTSADICDAVIPDATADGFRLLASDEWELAARYIDDANSDGDIQDTYEYYQGNYASGADDAYDQTAATDYDGDGDTESTINVAVYSGSGSTAAVKSKSPNKLGLYNMSGNVWEWIFDLIGSEREVRGGAWDNIVNSLQVGTWGIGLAFAESDNNGFRFARSVD